MKRAAQPRIPRRAGRNPGLRGALRFRLRPGLQRAFQDNDEAMPHKDAKNLSPRINNRKALHDYHIDARLECGLSLRGSEVKSLRDGTAQLHEAFARIENGELWLYGLHIDPYKQAAAMFNHEPTRSRKLLVHKREIKRLTDATREKGTTLIPLAIFFNERGIAKLELAVARGKQHHDKRASIKKKEMDRDLRRATMRRG